MPTGRRQHYPSGTKNPHTIAHLINSSPSKKATRFRALPPESQAEVVLFLSKASKQEILPSLSDKQISKFLAFNDEDDAADVLQFIDNHREKIILRDLARHKRAKIKKVLPFHPKTAGGLMDLNYILIKEDFTLHDVAQKIERHIKREQRIPLVLVGNKAGKVFGYIPYKNLILRHPRESIFKIVKHLPLISQHAEQEKVLKEAIRKKSDAIGVVDEEEKIIGIIHLNDLIHIIENQSSKDLYKFAGVNREEDMDDKVRVKVKRRYKWLVINLATAFLAAAVVAIFENTIAKFAILAVYMPIIAGEGGNAGTQALAVVVRGLASGETTLREAKKVIRRETTAGLINGLIVGTITSATAILFNASPLFGVIVGLAMVINLFVAGLFGASIPFILKRLNIDPATASSIFVTTATDVFGFFALLGLGALLLN